jgi:hypothetical protein
MVREGPTRRDHFSVGVMPRRPATFTQSDVARTIRAAKQAGATEVEVRVGEAVVVVRLTEAVRAATLDPEPRVVL